MLYRSILRHDIYTHLHISTVISVSMSLETARMRIFSIMLVYWSQDHFVLLSIVHTIYTFSLIHMHVQLYQCMTGYMHFSNFSIFYTNTVQAFVGLFTLTWARLSALSAVKWNVHQPWQRIHLGHVRISSVCIQLVCVNAWHFQSRASCLWALLSHSWWLELLMRVGHSFFPPFFKEKNCKDNC